MSFVVCQRGLGSKIEYAPERLLNLCPSDGRPIEQVLDLEALALARPAAGWFDPLVKNMWRFGGLLALDRDDQQDGRHIVSLGEGATPLLEYPTHPVAARAGLRLAVKDEGCAHPGFGSNPTRSFKDRGMAMTVSMARRHGLSKLAVPTQGNAGDSLAEYALAAGLAAAIVMPDDTPAPILQRVAELQAQHPQQIRLDLVRGTIREAGAVVRDTLVPAGYFSVATFQEPGWRIEGKKTLGLELAEDGLGGWRLPDVIVYPTGGGTGILGMWKAFEELAGLGLIDARRPRMIAVQSAATAPLVRAFDTAAPDSDGGPAGHTVATGLNVPGGVGHFRVLQILRASGGAAIAVSEEAIVASMRSVCAATGWRIGPEGAATLAALEPLLDRGLIEPGQRVVVVNTGSWDKYLPNLDYVSATR